jgi:hypothetical protein
MPGEFVMGCYEVRCWRIVAGMRLGREVVCVSARDVAHAMRIAPAMARKSIKPPEGVEFQAIDAALKNSY